MDIRYPSHPDDFEAYTTARTRAEFLIENLFQPGRLAMTYSHFDRMIIGGACPKGPLDLIGGKELGTEYFLERREMGVINVGPPGAIKVDGRSFELAKTEGLYVGLGARKVVFESVDPARPAHFYFLSGAAHQEHLTTKVTMAEAERVELGTVQESNVRTLNKYIHPAGVKSCNLVMGVTSVAGGSVWNSMPCHTHERRMEVYFYFDLAPQAVMFHFMGQPQATRHIVMKNEEAVISPSWSIHAGAGTSNYSFIWGMVGDNQTFADMDSVALGDLR